MIFCVVLTYSLKVNFSESPEQYPTVLFSSSSPFFLHTFQVPCPMYFVPLSFPEYDCLEKPILSTLTQVSLTTIGSIVIAFYLQSLTPSSSLKIQVWFHLVLFSKLKITRTSISFHCTLTQRFLWSDINVFQHCFSKPTFI